jgi:hypothetical protein
MHRRPSGLRLRASGIGQDTAIPIQIELSMIVSAEGALWPIWLPKADGGLIASDPEGPPSL